jgi:hypothetical protein
VIPKKLSDEIKRWMDEKRYGSLQINFQDGKIVNVNMVQSMKVDAIGIILGTTNVIATQSLTLTEPQSL